MSTRLVDPELGTLELEPADGFRVRDLDLGYPAARVVSDPRVNANGTDDRTEFYGSRVVSLTCLVQSVEGRTRRQALDLLRAYASPRRRPVLIFDEDGTGDERQVRLRGDQLGWPLSTAVAADVQVAWTAPDGILEAVTESSVSVSAVPITEPGRSYPRTYPLTYPAISLVGAVDAPNAGTEPAAPVMQLWGPCTDPALVNASTGEQLRFTGLTLTGSQYVEVDVKAATVLLNGRAGQSLYSSMDLLASSLWWLQAGSNLVRYSPASYDPAAHAVLTYRSAWI